MKIIDKFEALDDWLKSSICILMIIFGILLGLFGLIQTFGILVGGIIGFPPFAVLKLITGIVMIVLAAMYGVHKLDWS